MASVAKKELNSIMPVSIAVTPLLDYRSPNVGTVSSQASAWEKISNYGHWAKPIWFFTAFKVKVDFTF